MSTGRPHHFGHLFNLLTSQTSFHDLIHVYSRSSGADNPQGTKFWCQQKPLVTSVICYTFQKHIFEVWFYTHFFISFIARAGGGTKFWCQQEHLVTSVICYKFQKNHFVVWFYTFFFFLMILYMYIAPGQGLTAPRGQSFDVNRNVSSLFFCCKFQKTFSKVWFYTFF